MIIEHASPDNILKSSWSLWSERKGRKKGLISSSFDSQIQTRSELEKILADPLSKYFPFSSSSFNSINRKFIYPSIHSLSRFSVSIRFHFVTITDEKNCNVAFFLFHSLLRHVVTREMNIDDGNVTWQLKITRYLTLNGWLKIDIHRCMQKGRRVDKKRVMLIWRKIQDFNIQEFLKKSWDAIKYTSGE